MRQDNFQANTIQVYLVCVIAGWCSLLDDISIVNGNWTWGHWLNHMAMLLQLIHEFIAKFYCWFSYIENRSFIVYALPHCKTMSWICVLKCVYSDIGSRKLSRLVWNCLCRFLGRNQGICYQWCGHIPGNCLAQVTDDETLQEVLKLFVYCMWRVDLHS